MCGIFGYAGFIHPEKQDVAWRLLRNLARESEIRGLDSTGFSCRYKSNGIVVSDKMPMRASTFVRGSSRFKKLKRNMPETFIGHTRLGTGSSPLINNNNHPFFGDKFHMVHNGVIPSWKSIQEKHDLDMRSETDSEIILRLLELQHKEKNLNDSVQWVLDNIWGNMAIALLDKTSPNIWLFRNENPISVFQIPAKIFGEEIFFFSSLTTIFGEAWKETFNVTFEKDGVQARFLEDNKLFSISPDAKKLSNDAGMHKFIAYSLGVKNKFSKGAQYSVSGVRHYVTPSRTYTGKETSFYSTIVDPLMPQHGCRLPEKELMELNQKVREKNAEETIRIDGMSPRQYGYLKTLVHDLWKLEMDEWSPKEIKDVQNIREARSKTLGTESIS